jgi:hypothetical protein
MVKSQHHYSRYKWFMDALKGQSVDGYCEVHHIVPRSLGGSVTLSGVLDRVIITTVNGTGTFRAGSINILYEG